MTLFQLFILLCYLIAVPAGIYGVVDLLRMYSAAVDRHNERIKRNVARIDAVNAAMERSRIDDIIEEMKTHENR